MTVALEEVVLHGVSISRGIAIGRLYLVRGEDEEIPHLAISDDQVENEIKRFRLALRKTRKEIRQLQNRLRSESIPEGAAILEAHVQMLKDALFSKDIERQIRALGKNAEYIFHQTLQQCRTRFNTLSDPFFRERSKDVEDIGKRILGHLTARHRFSLLDIPPDSIVFAKDLTPSLVAEANQSRVGALLTESGGVTSHAAIVAKAKGIPYISSIPFDALAGAVNAQAIVDARTGTLILYPTKKTLDEYRQLKQELEEETLALKEIGRLDAETYDGYSVNLSANIDVDNEIEMLHQFGGKGVGLYRSEVVFLSQNRFPTEEEQYRTYKKIVDKLKGLPIVIRTFDVGGDKHVINSRLPKEGNPFLGRRAIRFLLKEKDIFRSQIRAILRASCKGSVSIMFPMVSALSELREAKAFVLEMQDDLKKQKIPHAKTVKMGCMIEVPSAAIIADLLAPECDFLSIGTNDLVQYSLAVDRSDQSLSEFYTPTHPGIIRLIKMTVAAGQSAGIPVSICGEVAADERLVPLLLGLGVQELSVAARLLPEIKKTIRQTSIVQAIRLADKALRLSTAQEIDALIAAHYHY